MGVTGSNKVISTDRIDCAGSLSVTLALSAAPDIVSNPTDIVLLLDRSGSMAGTPMVNMKLGAKIFVDIIAEATEGAPDQIGSGSRIAIVSFAETAIANTQLITSVDALKNAADALNAGGNTNHAAAFEKAMELLDQASGSAKVIVMFTDGNTTVGLPPAPVAEAAKAKGIIIYCIGLIGTSGLDVDALNTWASDPDATHVAVTPDASDLEELFAELAANISKAGATGIVIDEKVNPDFEITSIQLPAKGTVAKLDDTTLRWSIPELGVTASENAVLEFFIRHVAQTQGEKQVNASITYSDNEGNVVAFPDPRVMVECDVVVYPEPCPTPVDFTVESCADAVQVDMGDTWLESQGRIIQMDVTIRNVCPGKRVALAAILTEVDEEGNEHQRGVKTMTIPAHSQTQCRDVKVKCIKFVVPEDQNLPDGSDTMLCKSRQFKASFIAHYMDTDYRCCEREITL